MQRFTVLFLFITLSLSWALPSENVRLGSFEGRSGNIILHSQEPDNSFVVFLPNDLSLSEKAVHDTQFADLVSQQMGLPPLNPSISRSSFPASDIFNTPAANIFVVIDSVPSDVNMQILDGRTRYSIVKDAYSIDTSSRLTTLLSGQTPSAHGIIGDSWFDRSTGSTVNALDSWNVATAGSHAPSLQDWFTVLHSGQSLVLSASASERLAKLLSAKSFVLDPKKSSGNQAIYWNRKSSSSIYLSEKSRISISLDSIKKSLSSFDAFSSECTPSATWDSSSPESTLLIEIGMMDGILTALETSPYLAARVADSIPDLFSFGFSGLKPLLTAYGADSPAAKCGLSWISSSIQKMISRIGNLYNKKIMTEVVFLQSLTPDEKIISQVQDSVQASELATCKGCIKSKFPNVYLAGNLSKSAQEQVCEKIAVNVDSEKMRVECMSAEPAKLSGAFAAGGETMRVSRNAIRASSNDSSEAATFQFCLWTTIGLGVAVAAASYVMFTIDISTDMMLFADDIKYLKYT